MQALHLEFAGNIFRATVALIASLLVLSASAQSPIDSVDGQFRDIELFAGANYALVNNSNTVGKTGWAIGGTLLMQRYRPLQSFAGVHYNLIRQFKHHEPVSEYVYYYDSNYSTHALNGFVGLRLTPGQRRRYFGECAVGLQYRIYSWVDGNQLAQLPTTGPVQVELAAEVSEPAFLTGSSPTIYLATGTNRTIGKLPVFARLAAQFAPPLTRWREKFFHHSLMLVLGVRLERNPTRE